MDRKGRRKIGEEEEERLKRNEEAAAKCCGDSKEDLNMVTGKKRKYYSAFGDSDAAESRNSRPVENTNFKEEDSRIIGEVRVRTPVLEDIDSSSKDCESGGETSSTSVYVFFRGEASFHSDSCGGSQDIISFHPKPRQSPKAPIHVTALLPSPSELEEFFTAAEIFEKKRFSEKYNYDVMMDVPLKGRFQWVPLHPKESN